jgi:putative ABC transport system substrate-binding protein
LPILDYAKRRMKVFSTQQLSDSDARKSETRGEPFDSAQDQLRRTIQNRKWTGLVVLVLTFAMCGAVVEAQHPKKVYRIGYLSAFDPAGESSRSEAIRLALGELGYIEGQNIAIDYRYTDGRVNRFSELAAELVRLKVDIILVAGGGRVIQAAKNATKTIPIVMTGGGIDPVEAGFVESLARPGGNVTGITNLTGALGGKRLELLKEAVPKLVRVAVLYDPAIRPSVHDVKEVLPLAAQALGLIVRSWEVRDANGFEKVFAALNKERQDALYMAGGGLMNANRKRIAAFALKNRLPSLYYTEKLSRPAGSCPTGRTSRTATVA